MRKIIWLLLLSLNVFGSPDLVISKDTTINNTLSLSATTILRFTNDGHISGTGKLTGGIIDASMSSNIFDTTFTVEPSGVYTGRFSARWYGAHPGNSDNTNNLNKGVNASINNPWIYYIPAGTYNFANHIFIADIQGGNYANCTIHIQGETAFWGAPTGTVLNYTNTNYQSDFAIGLQFNKGSEIDHLTLRGMFVSPQSGVDSVYGNIPFAQYLDANQSFPHSIYYYGISIDPYTNQNHSNSGSTGCQFHDLKIEKFATLLTTSRNGETLNGEVMLFDRIYWGNARLAIQLTQAQQKGMVFNYMYAWGDLHTLLEVGFDVKQQGGNFSFNHTNIAGNVIRLFNIQESGWNQISFDDIYAERLVTLGYIQSLKPVQISNSSIHYNYPQYTGAKQPLGSFSGPKIKFTNTTFEYPGDSSPMWFEGSIFVDNCLWSGSITGGMVKDITLPSGIGSKRIQ